MWLKKSYFYILALLILSVLTACSNGSRIIDIDTSTNISGGQIYLYGEQHGEEKILRKELELWGQYYHEENMRHLFIEMPYFTAEFLNSWIQSESDVILEEVYEDWKGSPSYNPYVKEFYVKIKRDYPETIFHGTDLGHQYFTTGKRFLKYLEENNLVDTEKYELSQKSIEQGRYFYKHSDDVYRENIMVENFIREFNELENKSIMGIYGGAHTDLNAMVYNDNSVPCMANQLREYYGDDIYSEDLIWLLKDIEPIRVDTITINGKNYEASYFGKMDLTMFKDYKYREFWRLENAYEDFKDNKKIGDLLPYSNYPMLIETGQIFVIDYTKTDGSVSRSYYRSDGFIWNGLPTTEWFIIE